MTALSLPRLNFDRRAILRAISAGAAWGAVVSTTLLGLLLYQCGTICFGQILETTALSVAAGILAIGPVAMLRCEAPAPAQ